MKNYKMKLICKQPKLRRSRPVIASILLTVEKKDLTLYVGTDPNFEIVCELYMMNERNDIRNQLWYKNILDLLPEQRGYRYFNYCYQSYKKAELPLAFETMGKVLARLLEYENSLKQ